MKSCSLLGLQPPTDTAPVNPCSIKAKASKGFFDQLFNTLKNFVVFQIASSIVSGFIQSITYAIQAASEFDQTLHSLKAITGSTVSESVPPRTADIASVWVLRRFT